MKVGRLANDYPVAVRPALPTAVQKTNISRYARAQALASPNYRTFSTYMRFAVTIIFKFPGEPRR